jgi:hypothetical protein
MPRTRFTLESLIGDCIHIFATPKEIYSTPEVVVTTGSYDNIPETIMVNVKDTR